MSQRPSVGGGRRLACDLTARDDWQAALRAGMDDVDDLREVGPRLTDDILLRHQRDQLHPSLAGRAVFSTDFANWRYQGITIAPARLDLIFGFDGLNDSFDEDRPKDARSGRPAYSADDAFIGTAVSLGLAYGLAERLRLFGGVHLGFGPVSANDDRPLHRDDLTLGISDGLRWTIFAGERRVEQ